MKSSSPRYVVSKLVIKGHTNLHIEILILLRFATLQDRFNQLIMNQCRI